MKDKLTVYLAGPISGKAYTDCTAWRSEAASFLRAHRIIPYSPLRGKLYLKDMGPITDSYEEHALSTEKAIITRDRWDSTRCDLLFAYVLDAERVSIGTCMEIAWADSKRIPIVLVERTGGLHDHAMLRGVAGWVVEDLRTGLEIATKVLLP